MINMIERITALRLERHWSEYQLAEKSGVSHPRPRHLGRDVLGEQEVL